MGWPRNAARLFAKIWRLTGVRIGVFLLALPFVLNGPYWWFVFRSSYSSRIVSEELEREHRNVHLGSFFLLTFGLFALLCGVAGVIAIARSLWRNRLSIKERQQL